MEKGDHICLANSLTAAAAVASICFHMLKNGDYVSMVPLFYFLGILMYQCLITTFVLFCIYLRNLVKIQGKEREKINK